MRRRRTSTKRWAIYRCEELGRGKEEVSLARSVLVQQLMTSSSGHLADNPLGDAGRPPSQGKDDREGAAVRTQWAKEVGGAEERRVLPCC